MNIETVGKLVVVILVLLVVVIATIIGKLIIDKQFQNSISQAKLALTSGIEKKDGKDVCYVVVSNRSFSNVVVESLGFKDKLKETDFLDKYKAANNCNQSTGVVILARSSIRLEVDFDEIYELFADYKIDRIKCYTIDSLGFRRNKKCKIIRKAIKIIATPIFKEKLKAEKAALKEQKKQAIYNEEAPTKEEYVEELEVINENPVMEDLVEQEVQEEVVTEEAAEALEVANEELNDEEKNLPSFDEE